MSDEVLLVDCFTDVPANYTGRVKRLNDNMQLEGVFKDGVPHSLTGPAMWGLRTRAFFIEGRQVSYKKWKAVTSKLGQALYG